MVEIEVEALLAENYYIKIIEVEAKFLFTGNILKHLIFKEIRKYNG
jgi:hypothetical protein